MVRIVLLVCLAAGAAAFRVSQASGSAVRRDVRVAPASVHLVVFIELVFFSPQLSETNCIERPDLSGEKSVTVVTKLRISKIYRISIETHNSIEARSM